MEKNLLDFENIIKRELPTATSPSKGKIFYFSYGLFECEIENGQLVFGFRLYENWNIYRLKSFIDYWLKSTGGFLSADYYELADDKPGHRGKRSSYPTTGDIFCFVS